MTAPLSFPYPIFRSFSVSLADFRVRKMVRIKSIERIYGCVEWFGWRVRSRRGLRQTTLSQQVQQHARAVVGDLLCKDACLQANLREDRLARGAGHIGVAYR